MPVRYLPTTATVDMGPCTLDKNCLPSSVTLNLSPTSSMNGTARPVRPVFDMSWQRETGMNSGGGGIGLLMEGEGRARACAAPAAPNQPPITPPQKNLSTANKVQFEPLSGFMFNIKAKENT